VLHYAESEVPAGNLPGIVEKALKNGNRSDNEHSGFYLLWINRKLAPAEDIQKSQPF
jgi:hypothetical protein